MLACLREGLTNEEIARRLGIALDGAKFHVSEILLRLGVDSRYEAAEWTPEREQARGRWAFVLAPFALLHRAKWSTASYAAATVVVLGAAVGVALLAWGVMRSNGAGSAQPTPGANAIGAANPDLIIYTTLAPGSASGTHMKWTVSVFDTSVGRVTHRFEIGDGVGDQPIEVVAAGDKLVANLSDRIVRYDMDGTHATDLLRVDGNIGINPPRIIGIGTSPDGTKIALTEQTQQLCPTAVGGRRGATAALPRVRLGHACRCHPDERWQADALRAPDGVRLRRILRAGGRSDVAQ